MTDATIGFQSRDANQTRDADPSRDRNGAGSLSTPASDRVSDPAQVAELGRLLSNVTFVQAGAWLAGFFRRDSHASVGTDLAIPGYRDPCSDVPIPDWPWPERGTQTIESLDRFAAAGLLSVNRGVPTGSSADLRFVQTALGRELLPAFPLFHYRNGERLVERFPALPGAVRGLRVLDAGCGFGTYSVFLASLGAAGVLALDYDEDRLGRARLIAAGLRAKCVEFARGSVEALPIADGGVNFIFCRVVLPLVNHERTMSEFGRVLSPGGQALLMLHAPRYYLNMIKRLAPTRDRMREFVYGLLGLAGGAAFDLFGREPRWRLISGPFHLLYERAGSFGRLAARHGLSVDFWQQGVPKPYVWLRRSPAVPAVF